MRTSLSLLHTLRSAFAYMGKYAQHTATPCNQRPPDKQLLLKTYNLWLQAIINHYASLT